MDWSLSLSAEPQAIGEARRHLRGALSGCGIDEQHMQDALLVTSELVTNAVRHGSCQGDRVDLEIQLVDHRLSLCVRDAGRLKPKPAFRQPHLPTDARLGQCSGMTPESNQAQTRVGVARLPEAVYRCSRGHVFTVGWSPIGNVPVVYLGFGSSSAARWASTRRSASSSNKAA